MDRALTVYCSASKRVSPKYADLAKGVGNLFAETSTKLVYGGGDSGMMGHLARACLEGGGEVLGVIPLFLVSKEGSPPESPKLTIEYVRTLSQRRLLMERNGMGAIALPGGYGTLDELFSCLSLRSLNVYRAPIWIVNTEGFWDPLLYMIRYLIREKFALELPLRVVKDVEELRRDSVFQCLPECAEDRLFREADS